MRRGAGGPTTGILWCRPREFIFSPRKPEGGEETKPGPQKGERGTNNPQATKGEKKKSENHTNPPRVWFWTVALAGGGRVGPKEEKTRPPRGGGGFSTELKFGG